MTKRRNIVCAAWAVILVPLLYISTCSVISSRTTRAFEKISVGDSEQQVSEALGTPSIREKSAVAPFRRYTAYACKPPCADRFWYENRMGMDLEAWSIEFDASGKVIKKSKWTSP